MDYQQIRDSNIARNENWLEANGLLNRAKQITVLSRKRRVREHSEPIRRSHRVELANSITPDFEEVSDLYSIDLSGGMICNACHNLVQSKSNNRNLSWRSHQSKCAQTNNKTTNLLRVSNSENIRDDLEFDHSGVMGDEEDRDELPTRLRDESNGSCLEYQRRIGQLYDYNSAEIPYHVRGGRRTTWQQYALIHEFVVKKIYPFRTEMISLI